MLIEDNNSPQISHQPSIEINGIRIYKKNVDRLKPQQWLDDSLVDLTISIVLSILQPALTAAKLQVHIFSTLLISLINKDYINPEDGVFDNYQDISNMDYLFFPLVHANHFSCVVVENIKALTDKDCLHNMYIHHMDSMIDLHNRDHFIEIVRHFLLKKLGINDQSRTQIKAIRSLGQLPTPQQTNSWDCGLYVSENIKHLLQGAIRGKHYDERNSFKFEFSQVNISKNRLILYDGLKNVFDHRSQELDNNNVVVIDFDDFISKYGTANELLLSNNVNVSKISELSEQESKTWDSTREHNVINFYGNQTRTYVLFKLPYQCGNAPKRVLLYYRQDYEPFEIYAHFEIDVVVLRGKAYFSMCVLYNVTCGSNFILVAVAYTTCTSPIRRYWIYDRAAKRFLEWNDKQISSFSCVPTIEFDEPAMIEMFRDHLKCERKLYDANRGIKFTSKNAAKSNDDIPDLDKFVEFDDSRAIWKGTRDPVSWQKYLDMTGIINT